MDRDGGYRLAVATDSVEVGGAEVFLVRLLAGLPGDVDVTVLGPDPATLSTVAAARPGTGARMAADSPGPMRAALRAEAPDVLHANLTTFTACRGAVLAALSLGVPVVLVDHAPTPGLTWRGRAVQRAVTAAAARRVSIGRRSSRLVERYGGLAPGSVRTIHNGVPRVVPRAGDPGRPRPALGVLGRLEPEKGVDLLLRALAQVPRAHLLVAGEGRQRAALEALADELGLADRVRFLGHTRDLAGFFGSVDVVVLPSRTEGLPLTMLEAMRAGLPVVASDVGSVCEALTDGVDGLLVPALDVDALAAALRRLLRDDALRARLARSGQRRSEAEFGVEQMVARYDALYRQVAGRW